MLCRHCERVAARFPASHSPHEVGDGNAKATLRVLLCERCGAVLEANRADDVMLKRLTQLARFGIGGGSGPLLSSDTE